MPRAGFVPQPQEGRAEENKLDITYKFSEDEEVRFTGFEPLGADDMRLLQGLVGLAGPNGILLSPAPEKPVAKDLRRLLEPKFEAAEQDAMVVRESMERLLIETGLTDGGDNIKGLKASLHRMSNVTVKVTKGKKEASFHLMSYAFDGETGKLFAALNPRIAEAVLGQRQYAHIDMAEVRALQSDPARLIHQRLCGWLNLGKTRKVEIDTLCSYVWPDVVSDGAMRRRRSIVRKALAELVELGWTVSERGKGKYEITRPKRRP